MDFGLDETQEALRELAAGLLAKEASQERLEAHERGRAPYDPGLWQALRAAGLTAICVPESAGGAGLGPVEMAVVLREAGARAAPGPLAATLVSTLAASRYGTPDQQSRLNGAAGSTVAIREPGRAPADPPATTAQRKADGWALTGRKCGVAFPDGDVLVTAAEGLFLARLAPAGPPAAATPEGGPAGEGVTTITTPEFCSTGEPAATITFDAAPAERVAGPEAVAGVRLLYTVAVAAQASGVLAGALRLTVEHVRNRRQFGRALAEFQAVTTQVADVYITARALDVALWSGAWRLAEGLPAEEDVVLAGYHTTEAARALYTCQHLHGGLGLDVTYPLHRYFAHAKHLAHLLGGADAQLDLIGALA
ncbi:acyl-CoA/acyl-ACP dehydrogenase [Nonomuraea sp. MCN248]|uniref:Acyl-CoA/acyl-ACP dehydrogenase n=1 Tax=Nonomuraea corallina TaxID=2989783 RepID=A0ABT4SBZ9_9ACTN|nr:acyl-CoA dehydrogenase family protein [Nonomuraea corallina]MDA0634704.1 acyl-CoA/acyl-ACP dehydrogenase [Nonomuraea corallina]